MKITKALILTLSLNIFFSLFCQANISYPWTKYIDKEVDKKTMVANVFPYALSALNLGLNYKYGSVWRTLDSQHFFTLNPAQRGNILYGQGSLYNPGGPTVRKEIDSAIHYRDSAVILSLPSAFLSHIYAGTRAAEQFANAYEYQNNRRKCAYHAAMGLGFTADSILLGSTFATKTSPSIKYGLHAAALTVNGIEIAKEGYQAYSLWNTDRNKAWNHLSRASLAVSATILPFMVEYCMKNADLEKS